MSRKCKLSTCRAPIPPYAKSETILHKKGYCGINCAAKGEADRARNARERAQATERKKAREARAAERKAYRAAKRERNENSLSHQKALTQSVFNKMIRLLDAGKPCISCGKMECGFGWDAGHYHSVASSPELRYDPRNCHLQGNGCNRTNHKANYKRRINMDVVNAGYQQGLVDRFGIEFLNFLDSHHEPKHYSLDDVKELRALFSAECRRLEKGEGPSRDWRKI